MPASLGCCGAHQHHPDFTDLKYLHAPLTRVSCLAHSAMCCLLRMCPSWTWWAQTHSLTWLYGSACSDSDIILFVCLFSDGPICRICHEGGSGEGLLSPCDCTGTLGTVHKSCLEKWLSSSNTSYCELCHTEFVVERRPRPLTEVLLSPCFTLSSLPLERT